MIGSKQKLALLAGATLAAGAIAAAPGLAFGPGGPHLTGVPAANTKSDGYAPASVLSPELSQTAVAQGSTKLENTSALTFYYGYDNNNSKWN